MSKKPLKESLNTLFQLTKRNMKLFLADKANVFFSLLAPLIVLVLYILFLADLQVESVINSVPPMFQLDKKAVQAYVDSWMMAGVLSVSCITVSLGANTIMVQDRTKGILSDFLTSPVKRWTITASYFIYNFVTTVIITTVAFAACLIYLAASGGWYLTFGDVMMTLVVLLMSALSATLFTVFVCGLFRTEAALTGFISIISAVIGFFIGAYMPMSIMPKGLQYVSALLPGSHSAGIFRTYLMSGAMENLGQGLPRQVLDKLSEYFAMKINFFGENIGINIMYIYLAGSIVVFGALSLIFSFRNGTDLLVKRPKTKK